MNKLAKNYIYNILYQLFLLIVPVITAPYLARVLGANQLGIYSYVNSVSNVIATLGLVGLNNYGTRQIAYYQDDKNKRSVIFRELMIARLVLLFIVTIGYTIFITETEYKVYFIIQYLLIVSMFCDVSWFMIGLENMGIIVFRNFLAKFLTVIGIFILVKDPSDLWIYLMLYSLITFLTTISLLTYVKKHVKKVEIKMKNVFLHLKPSLSLFIPQVATIINMQAGKIMLKFYTEDTSEIAFYDQADKIVQIPLALITALGTVMMPRIAAEFKRNNHSAIKDYINKTLEIVLFLAIPMMFGIAAIAPTFIPWYLGNEFEPVIEAVVILSPIIVFSSLNTISGVQFFVATNQTGILTKSYTSAAIVNIIINIIVMPIYSYKGAAFSMLLSSLTSIVIQYYYLSRQVNIKSNLANSQKYFFMSSLMGISVYILGNFLEPRLTTTIFQIILGIAIYSLLLYISKDKMLGLIFSKIL